MSQGPEAEFEEFDAAGSWGVEYQKIRNEASLNHDFSLKDSRKPDFRSRNRYRDVSPYDHSRVILQRDGIDYINANIVKAPDANRQYILTQGPLSSTSGHFWLMVWEHNSLAVLMLNRVIEKGMIKCHQYFPEGPAYDGEKEMVFDDVDLKVTYITENDLNYFTIRTLELEDLRSGETKQVLQFHYTTWPDFGVPQSPAAFLNFLMAVRHSGALEPDVGPPIIHCSAGIGRSGTFCLVDTCLVLIAKNQDANSTSVREILMDMRQYRMGLIQTPDQLRFSYMAIIEGARRILSSSSPDSGFDDLNEIGLNLNEKESDFGFSHRDNIPDQPPPLPPRKKHTLNNNSAINGATDKDNLLSEQNRKTGVDIRRRKREERQKNVGAQLEKMKKKQRESENWQSRKRKLRPYAIGISMSVILGGMLLLRYYWS